MGFSFIYSQSLFAQIVYETPKSPISINFNSVDNYCPWVCDASIISIVTGGTTFSGGTYKYLWNDGHTTPNLIDLCPGNYHLTITDSLGDTASAYRIIDSHYILASFCTTPLNSFYPCDVSFTYTGQGPIISYEWFFGDGSTSTNMNPTHTYLNPGSYAVQLNVYPPSPPYNCFFSSFDTIDPLIPESVNEIIEKSSINLYPNPAYNILTVETPVEATIEIFNINGKLLLSKQLITNKIDISTLAKGLYFIKLSTAEGSVVRKFVKE